MTLLEPGLAPLLLGAPLAAVALWALERARARGFRRLLGPRAAALAGGAGSGLHTRWWFAAALLLALGALLQPAWGEAGRAPRRRGVDLMLCLDVSRSMLARDLEPDRLARAREELRGLARRAQGDRAGLVAFAGEARLIVPLTRDLDSFAELAARTGPLDVARGGTDLAAALERARDALGTARDRPRVIVLLTDGEDHGRRGLEAARDCAARGIAVHCLGFGTALGAKIPVPSAGGGETHLRDRAGNEVITSLTPATLRALTTAAAGEYAEAGNDAGALARLYERRIEPLARFTVARRAHSTGANRYQWLLAAAYLLWLVDLARPGRRRA